MFQIASYSTSEREDFVFKLNAQLFQQIYYQCLHKTRSLRPSELMTQKRELCYLDLAINSGSGKTWQRYVMVKYIGALPLICAEYLIIDTVVLRSSGFRKSYRKICSHHATIANAFNRERRYFTDQVCMEYERHFITKIITIDDLLRIKKAVQGMLFVYRMFDIPRFELMYEPLLYLCTQRIMDPALTIELLRTLCSSDSWKSQAFGMNVNDDSLKTMIRHASQMRFSFWGLWQGDGQLSYKFNAVICQINHNRYSKANILLKYGFPYSVGSYYKHMCISLLCTRFQEQVVFIHEEFIRFVRKENRIRVMLILQTLRAFANFEGTGESSERIKTLVYLTRSLPYPYVTPAEMSSELSKAFHPFFSEEFDRICNAYNDMNAFDKEEGHRVHKPRRLVHLSRCAVRKVMVSNLRLMDDVDKLNMDEELKPYLKLEK